MELIIDKSQNLVYISENETHEVAPVGTIECAFGNICDYLESREQPCQYNGDDIITHIKAALNGQDQIETLYGMPVSIFGICHILHDWFDGRDEIAFSLKDLDIIRIASNITENHKPIEHEDYGYHSGMIFTINSVLDVLFSLLYFYSFDGLKIKRCEHCKRWFAVKNFQIEYCPRISPCSKMMVNGKPLLNAKKTCKPAVRVIRQRLADRKNCIYQNYYANAPDKINDFLNQCAYYFDMIDKSPTVDNIKALHSYLYSDEMPNQQRPNRKKNSDKRKLLGL